MNQEEQLSRASVLSRIINNCYVSDAEMEAVGIYGGAALQQIYNQYNPETIKDKMRRGILWEGWLAAARRNARNG